MANNWPTEQALKIRLAALFNSPIWRNFPFVGTMYRFAGLKYSDRSQFTDGEGARLNGGRFTPIRGQRTLYLSLDRATAMAELDSWYAFFNIPDNAFRPRILAAVAVCVVKLLDVSSPETLAELGVTIEQIAEEWRLTSVDGQIAPTQTFGRLVYEAGYEGIRFPSVRKTGGLNFSLFPENYLDGSHALMLDSD